MASKSLYSRELEVSISAARNAAEIINSFAAGKSFDIELKGKNDLVTDADLASEKEIIQTIQNEFPDDLFLAEESKVRAELPDSRVWIIDPIDGTTNFAHGFNPYCVSIALWENGTPRVAVVLEVKHNELFSAVEGHGAILNGESISVSKARSGSESLIATGFPYNKFGMIDDYLSLLKDLMFKTHGIRRAGAASYDLCCVAAGRVDGFFEYNLSPWDVAAGSLIIKEAGGKVTDWSHSDHWLFGKRIVAGNNEIHSFLMDCIEDHFLIEQRKPD